MGDNTPQAIAQILKRLTHLRSLIPMTQSIFEAMSASCLDLEDVVPHLQT